MQTKKRLASNTPDTPMTERKNYRILTDAEKAAILGGTAHEVFPL
jgi:hypothetical protein